MADKLPDRDIAAALSDLPAWTKMEDRPALCRSFEFRDFNAAFAWMTRVAMLAEQMNHHPEWSNVYRRVDVVLTTHDAGGVTDRDISMAKAMEAFAEE